MRSIASRTVCVVGNIKLCYNNFYNNNQINSIPQQLLKNPPGKEQEVLYFYQQ